MLSIKITDQKKYEQIYNVDLSDCSDTIRKGQFDGDITIELNNGTYLTYSGDHGVYDFEKEFGFIIE